MAVMLCVLGRTHHCVIQMNQPSGRDILVEARGQRKFCPFSVGADGYIIVIHLLDQMSISGCFEIDPCASREDGSINEIVRDDV